MDIKKELSCDGVGPTGPCSAWPFERHQEFMDQAFGGKQEKQVNASMGKMAKGFARTATQALFNGKVSAEIRNERYDTCKACPLFIKDSKRCSDCGCFMEAKTWIGGDPSDLCPKQKWSR